jgi:hypothetical protein
VLSPLVDWQLGRAFALNEQLFAGRACLRDKYNPQMTGILTQSQVQSAQSS